MSASYNSHTWPHSQPAYNSQHTQLEHELDFPNTSDPHRRNQPQHNMYSLTTSSSLAGAINPNPPLSQSQSTSFVSTPQSNNGYPHSMTHLNPNSFRFDNGGSAPYVSSLASNFQDSTNTLLTNRAQPSRLQHSSPSSNTPHQTKRPRSQVFNNDEQDEDQEVDMAPDPKETVKNKPQGACLRCKNLKVKCEFKTDTDPCKRCLNSGSECTIPGRKKRKTPPKREHLLNQIREQAAQISELMSQLETLHARPALSVATSDVSSSSAMHSPVLSPSTSSYFSADIPPMREVNQNNETNKAVEDWLEKAKESLQEFGGFIGIGGAAPPRNYVVEEDFEDPLSSDDEFVDVDDEFGNPDDKYNFSIENPEGSGTRDDAPTNQLKHQSSASSLGTTATSTRGRRKSGTESNKPANLPGGASPFGMFIRLSLETSKRQDNSDKEDDKGSGIANADFFRPSPAPDAFIRRLDNVQHQAPHILTKGIITPVEAEKLFQIYFEKMNLSVSLLDPVMYTPQRTYYRSPFLFTVICAIASRFYQERQDLYPQAIHYAQLAAGTALISGSKNVEMCHAYILLSLYPVPARRWEDQRSWLYLGLAIRTATDLNLHLPTTAKPLNENHAREMLNRTRVWINCFNLDRSFGSQYGKPPIISSADYMANHAEDWWRSSPHNMKNFDIHTCAYNSELKVLARFLARIYNDPHHPTGLNKEVDFEGISSETDEELKQLWEKWSKLLETTDMSDPQNSFRIGLLRLAYSYARLVALSYGFQHAFGKNGTDENPFLMRCLRAASDVVNAVVDDICRPSQVHYFSHGPEAQSVFVTFASAFLVKLLQPKFVSYLNLETRVEIRVMVQKVVDLLGSPQVAVDERHGPKLYSKFLRNLLATAMARLDPNSPPPQHSSSSRQRPRQTKFSSGQSQSSEAFEIPPTVYTHPSPTNSLSPPPTQAALSFDNFAPLTGMDPFMPGAVGTTTMNFNSTQDPVDAMNILMAEDYFQPSLPFDQDIMRSMQSLSDPSGWQDISLPGMNWMSQFHQNLGLDPKTNGDLYESNPYMTS